MGKRKRKVEGPGNFYEAVYRLVRKIPRGRVMTYGRIAAILGSPRAARAVGYAMRACGRESKVPWQRVINGKGQVSLRGDMEGALLQQRLLEGEGVRFDAADCVDLERYGWSPRDPEKYFFAPSGEMPFR